MPRNWDKILVPLGVSGEDGTLDALSNRPPALDRLENFTQQRDGAIAPRPGFVEVRGRFWTSTINSLGSAGAYTALGGAGQCPFQGRSIASVRGQGEVPLFLADGRAYHLESQIAADWHDLGSFWSARVPYRGFVHQQEAFTGDPQTAGAVETGARDFYMAWEPINTGFVVMGEDGQRLSQYTPTRTSGLGQGSVYFAMLGNNPCAVYNTSLNELVLVQVSNADPHTFTETLIASDARATVGQFQEAVWDSATNRLYIAYLTTTATQIKLVSVTTALVTASVTYTHGNSLGAVALGLVNTRLVVAGCENVATLDIITKVYSAAAPPVDQALNVTLVPTGAGAPRFIVVGPAAGTAATVAWNTATDGSTELATRSTTAATSTTGRTWLGSAGSATSPAAQFQPRYAPFLRNGRVIMGLSLGTGLTAADTVYQHSWVLLDVTTPATDARYSQLVAQGPVLTSAPQWPSNVSVRGDGEALVSSNDFLSFFTLTSGVTQGEYYALRVAALDFDAQIPVVEANGAWLVGGSTTYHYDGAQIREAGFIHGPQIAAQNTAGGSLAAGVYACVSVWTWTDALGKTHRSTPSNFFNLTVAGGATATATLASTPNILSKGEGFVEFYMSTVNPPASGVFPLYKVRTVDNTFTAGTTTAAVTAVSTSFEQLYTADGVLENFPPQGSDGGLAATANRVWAATGRTLAASKLLENGPPAWNEGLEVVLPASGGDCVALLPDGDNLLVFCERAVYRVGGSGPDDLLRGPTFSDPVLVSDLGCTGACAVARTPAGVAFQGRDHGIYLLGQGVRKLSPSVDQGGTPLAPFRVSITHVPKLDAVVVVQDAVESLGYTLLWNYRNNQWARWQVIDEADGQPVLSRSCAVIDGRLWTGVTRQPAVASYVGYFDALQTTDLFEFPNIFTCRADTVWVRLDADRARGWARCGAVNLHGTVIGTHTVTVIIHRDYVELASPETHSFTATPISGSPVSTWPSERFAPEVRCAREKASAVKISVRSTRLRLNEIELDVRRAGPHAPSGQRVS